MSSANSADSGDPTFKIDALFAILEKHLYDFDDDEESEAAFIDKIVQDYVGFLASKKVVLPRKFHAQIVEELRDQVHKMLVKKMYGCLTLEEFVEKKQPQEPNHKARRRAARKKYMKLW